MANPEHPDILFYLKFLREKSGMLLASTKKILETLRSQDFNTFSSEVKTRANILGYYEDGVKSLGRVLLEQGFDSPEISNGAPVRFLRLYCDKNLPDSQSLEMSLEIKGNLEEVNAVNEIIMSEVEGAPEKLKLQLLQMQKKKPGIRAYQNNQVNLGKVNRFDRKK